MQNPFIFGKAAEGEFFTDRREDTARLKANLSHGINTILISPRRWGKTSLVKKVMAEWRDTDTRIVFIDVFHCKSAQDFYHTFATGVIRQTSSRIDEWIEVAKDFLANISPKFSFGSDPLNDFTLSFEWNPKDDSSDTILALPQRIAEQKGIKVVVCIDEFQQIAELPDSVTLQKRLRSVWQHQPDVTYCMFGSKRHLMEGIFNGKSQPFYKFGDLMFLNKIPTAEWVPFICDNFCRTGKRISEEQAARICQFTENLSSHVQHLAWLVWYRTDIAVTDTIINDAMDDLLQQNTVFFQREMEALTAYQTSLLHAIADGVETGFSRREILDRYRLESTANVQSIKKSLIKKDLVCQEGNNLVFTDALFKAWLKRHPRP